MKSPLHYTAGYFKPKINENSKNLLNSSVSRRKNVFRRLYNDSRLKQRKLSEKRNEFHRKECHFNPTITRYTFSRFRRKKGAVFSNLYKEAKIRRKKLRLLKQKYESGDEPNGKRQFFLLYMNSKENCGRFRMNSKRKLKKGRRSKRRGSVNPTILQKCLKRKKKSKRKMSKRRFSVANIFKKYKSGVDPNRI